MKKIQVSGYTSLVFLLWALLSISFWGRLYHDLGFIAATVLVLALLIPIILGTTFLTNYLLSLAVATKRMKLFVVRFFVCIFCMSLIFTLVCSLFYELEVAGYFPHSRIFEDREPYWLEVLAGCFIISLINLAFCGLRFYYEHSKLQEVHFKSHLQMLQAQVNPHFMFNVLNHIHILIRKDVDLASFLLEKYSEILRYQLYNSKKETVPLSQEIQFVKDVVSVERLRWGDELTVGCVWQIEDGEQRIEPLLLIIFVENAFKHVSRSITDKGYINLVVRQNGKIIYMEIENSKSKYLVEQKSDRSSGLGLKNINERLHILYPNRHTLVIDETDWSYKVELTITLQ